MNTKRPAWRPPSVFTPFLRRFTDERARDLADTIALYNRVRAKHRASKWSKPETPQALASLVIERVAGSVALPAAPALLGAVGRCLDQVIALEATIFTGPEIDWSRAVLSLKEQVDLRRFLRAQEHFLSQDDRIAGLLVTALGTVVAGIVKALPQLPEDAGAAPFTVPLITLVPNAGEIVDRIIGTVTDEHLQQTGLFTTLNRRLYENICAVSGLFPDEEHRKPFITADVSVLPAAELVAAYLGDTPFQQIFETQIPFTIPRKTYASHGIIVAPPNHGKTQLLGAICHGFLQEADPPGLFVLDPHGDLLAKIETLDVFHPEHGRLRDRLVILDPDTDPPDLNFLDLRTASEGDARKAFAYLMSALSGGLSDKQGAVALYLLKLLHKIPNPSIETLRLVIDEKVKSPDKSQFATAIRALDAIDQGFFNNQFYAPRMQDTKDAIGWKLYNALASAAFRKMFSAPRSSFNAHDAMARKQVVLVKGGRRALDDDGMSVFLQFIVAQFFVAALARERLPEEKRHLCLLLVDEAHHVFNSQTVNILTECRKYGLAWLGATQVVEQIPNEVKAAIYGATAIKIAGPVAYSDSVTLGREMYCSAEFIRSMKSVERRHADFAVYVRGMTDQAVRLNVAYGALESAPQMDAAAHARMRAANRSKMTVPVAASPPVEPEPPVAPKTW